jgi:hypothetical protein
MAVARGVTEGYSDTGAQLRAKRSLEERLLAIVASAKSVKEMLEVESELARVRTTSDARRLFVGVIAGIIVVLGALLPLAMMGGFTALAVRTIQRRRRAALPAYAV